MIFGCQSVIAVEEFDDDTDPSKKFSLESSITEDEIITEDEEIIDNSDVEFANLEELENEKINEEEITPLKAKEESLFEKLYKAEIERTDVPSYLLKDKLTFEFAKGPVSKVQFYGAYYSTFSSEWKGADYDTDYTNQFIQIGVIGKTRDKNTGFQGLFNLMPHTGRDFIQDFIADAYFINTRIPHHKLILGVSRNQIGVEGGLGAFTLPFAFRSQISRNFASTRALGARVVGDYSLVNYNLAFNSSDRYFNDFFPGVEFTGWVNFKPLGKTNGKYGNLVLGGGLNTGRNVYDYTVGGAYAAYKYKKIMANFEYAIADGYNGHYVSTDKASGFYTTLTYKLTPKIQLTARADHFDPNRDIKKNSKDEYSVGINYYIRGQALRLMLNYVFCNNHNAPDSNRIILGTQVLI